MRDTATGSQAGADRGGIDRGLERRVLEELCAVGLPMALVTSSRPKAFAQAMGQ